MRKLLFRVLAVLAITVLTASASVSNLTRTISYSCNGIATSFTFPFPITDQGDLEVYTITSTGARVPLTLTTDFTVTNQNNSWSSGGTVSRVSAGAPYACTSPNKLVIQRAVPQTQPSEYVEGRKFSQVTLMGNLDRLTMMNQDLSEEVGRSFKVPVGTSPLADLTPAANHLIGWNAAGTQLTNRTDGITLTTATGYEIDALVTYGSGTSFTQATIQSALTAIGTTNKVTLLLRPGTWVISSNADWSTYTNVVFKIVPGAMLQIATGTTTTIGGPLEAGLYQVFSGAGSVSLGSGVVKEIYPQWWGAKGDGSNDDSAAFAKAILSINTGVYHETGGTIRIPPGTYNANIIIDYNNIHLVGSGEFSTVIKPSAGVGISIIPSGTTGTRYSIKNLGVWGGTIGLLLGDSGREIDQITIENVRIYLCSVAGIVIRDAVLVNFINTYTYYCNHGLYIHANAIATMINFISCSFRQSTLHNLYLQNGKRLMFSGCVIESAQSTGVYIQGNVGEGGAQDILFESCWFEDNAYNTSLENTSDVYLDGVAGTEGCKNIVFNNCMLTSKSANNAFSSVYSNRSKDCKITNSDFYGKAIQHAVKYADGNAMTFGFLVKDYKNPAIADITNIQSFLASGCGITLDYTIGAKRYTNSKTINQGNLSASPGTGTWALGDKIYRSDVATAGHIGWICTVAGTPGTWVRFGLIILVNDTEWNPGSIANGSMESKNITVAGVVLGNYALPSFSLSTAGLTLTASVTAANTVTCILANNTGGAVDLGNGILRVMVYSHL